MESENTDTSSQMELVATKNISKECGKGKVLVLVVNSNKL